MSKVQGPRSKSERRSIVGRPAYESLALVLAAALLVFAVPASIAADARFGVLPLYFEANHGQADDRVQFFARGREHTVYLGADGATIALKQNQAHTGASSPAPLPSRGEGRSEGKRAAATNSVVRLVRMSLVGANPNPAPAAQERNFRPRQLPPRQQPAQWQQAVPTFAKVQYDQVYPGVDLIYYGNEQEPSMTRDRAGRGSFADRDAL